MSLFGKKDTTKKDTTKKDTAKKNDEKKEEKKEVSMKDLYAEGEKKVVKTKGKKGETKKVIASKQAYKVLVKPVITEKATHLTSQDKYSFVVDNDSNKIEVAKAIESVYGVKVVNVNLLNVKGKKVVRGRVKGKRKDIKKAIVTLAKGETIKLYEGV